MALLVQAISLSVAPTAASPEQRAAAALSAAIGQQVSLCAQGEHSGAPDQSCPCCDDCALCGVACWGAPTPLAGRVVALLAPARIAPVRFPNDDQAAAHPPLVISSVRSRAPPLSI
jgi:hypothetical protein